MGGGWAIHHGAGPPQDLRGSVQDKGHPIRVMGPQDNRKGLPLPFGVAIPHHRANQPQGNRKGLPLPFGVAVPRHRANQPQGNRKGLPLPIQSCRTPRPS